MYSNVYLEVAKDNPENFQELIGLLTYQLDSLEDISDWQYDPSIYPIVEFVSFQATGRNHFWDMLDCRTRGPPAT